MCSSFQSFPQTEQIRAHLSPEGLLWYSFPIFEPFREHFLAGFSSRLGGVSSGCLSSLNLGLSRGDEPSALRENYRRFCRALEIPMEGMVFSQQTHTTNLLEVDGSHRGQGLERPRSYQNIDGLLTREKELPLITFYADCTPLLFYAADRQIAAASHAGWRGTVADMAGTTVRRLQSLGADPRQIFVAIGPSAGPERYQVDAATAEHFRKVDSSTLRPDPAEPGKFLADLWQANFLLLRRAGIPEENIAIAGLCTISHPEIFFSHRIHGEQRGAMAAALMLR
ncbi:MAG: peptidoglycan editing factor PgeF [Firmicutes bacterium]|nr:peptidoglycan editing factor PgeF [Bacillota bacterium]